MIIASLTLAALARERIVVVSAGPIAAHQAQFLLLARRWPLLRLLRIALVGAVPVQAAGRRQVFAACKTKRGVGKKRDID